MKESKMTKKRISIVAVLALALAIGVATATAGRGTTASPQMTKLNLVQTAVAAKQFKTLAALLKKSGLAGTLANRGPFTVFAPTDAAFAKVPKATLATLAKNKMKLRAVLLYHVVKGKVTAAQAMKLRSAKTLEGKSVSIRVKGGRVIVGGATVIKANVMATNGVIHVINKVLIPCATSRGRLSIASSSERRSFLSTSRTRSPCSPTPGTSRRSRRPGCGSGSSRPHGNSSGGRCSCTGCGSSVCRSAGGPRSSRGSLRSVSRTSRSPARTAAGSTRTG
jgi:uncharacterized surface protein with fasciclin (FAS1) repeats